MLKNYILNPESLHKQAATYSNDLQRLPKDINIKNDKRSRNFHCRDQEREKAQLYPGYTATMTK